MIDNKNYERNVIKQSFINKDVFLHCMEKIPTEDIFSEITIKLYWQIFMIIYKDNKNICYSTINDTLKFTNNEHLIADFENIINTLYEDENEWKYHLFFIHERYNKTILIEIAKNIHHNIGKKSAEEITIDVNNKIKTINSQAIKGQTFSNAYVNTINEIKSIKEGTKRSHIITGHPKFDEIVAVSEKRLIMLCSQKKIGKCFKKGTKVLMFDGSIKEIQDIKTGEKVMGKEGYPRNVLGTGKGISQMYEIQQSKGQSYTVNEEHILSLKSVQPLLQGKKRKRIGNNKSKFKTFPIGTITNISIKDYLQKSEFWKKNNKGYKSSVQYFKYFANVLPIDPYFLGLWLGDGTSAKVEITNIDKEIIDYIYNYASLLNMRVSCYKYKNKTSQYSIVSKDFKTGKHNPIKDKLKSLNVLNNKHIPDCYMKCSKADRLSLLAGLIDTDGHRINNGNKINGKQKECGYEIIQVNNILAKQIQYLSWSLGFECKITSKKTFIKSTGFKGIANRIYIRGDIFNIPCKIKRKITEPFKRKYDPTLSNINIISKGIGEYYGIAIDEDELFLLEDFTVVHNTAFSIDLMDGIVNFNENIAIQWYCLEMTNTEMIRRFISRKTKLTDNQLMGKNYSLNNNELLEIETAYKYFENYPIEFIDEPVNIFNICSKFEIFKQKNVNKHCICIIDNLGLITPHEKESLQYEDEIARMFKNLRDTTSSTIIVLHHLTKESETKWNKDSGYEPKIGHVRGSSRLVDFCNQCILLHRPDHYEDLVEQAKAQGRLNDIQGLFIVDVALNRSGETKKIIMEHELKYSSFKEK